MKALVLGAGQMARIAIDDLAQHGLFKEVIVGTRRPELAEPYLAALPYRTSTRAVAVDVTDHQALVALMRGVDVVCNLAGPNYLNSVPVARAAIGAGVPLVDVNDDWESTLALFALSDDAARAGITIIVGLGASPGVTNVMARYGVNQLDRAEEVRTSWIMRGSDMGGLALAKHLLHSLPDRAFVYENGAMREVRPFIDGREVQEFPELGPVAVTHIGHPEPFMLARTFPYLRYADDKATFLPVEVAEMIVELGRVVRPGHPVVVDGRPIDPMAFAAAYLNQTCARMTDVPTTGALRTEVRGELAGKPVRLVYTAAGRIGIGTGIPAAIGAQLLAIRKVNMPGVWPPEACLDPEWFLLAVEARRIGEVREEIFDWDRRDTAGASG